MNEPDPTTAPPTPEATDAQEAPPAPRPFKPRGLARRMGRQQKKDKTAKIANHALRLRVALQEEMEQRRMLFVLLAAHVASLTGGLGAIRIPGEALDKIGKNDLLQLRTLKAEDGVLVELFEQEPAAPAPAATPEPEPTPPEEPPA